MKNILKELRLRLLRLVEKIRTVINLRIEREKSTIDLVRMKYMDALQDKAIRYALENLDVLFFKLDEEAELKYRQLHSVTHYEEELLRDFKTIKAQIRSSHLRK